MPKRNAPTPRGRRTSSDSSSSKRTSSSRKRSDDFKGDKRSSGFNSDRPKKRSGGFSERSDSRGTRPSKSGFKRSESGSESRSGYKSRDNDRSESKFGSRGQSSSRPSSRPRRNDSDEDSKPRFRKDNGRSTSRSNFGDRDEKSGSKSGSRDKFPKRTDSAGSKPRFRKDDNRSSSRSKSFTKRDNSDYESKPRFRKDEDRSSDNRSSSRSKSFTKRGSSDYEAKPRFRKENSYGEKGSSSSKPFTKRDDERDERKSRFQKDRESSKEKFGLREDRDNRKSKGKKSFTPEPPDYAAKAPVQTGQIRLNRYIANSGICSRREADELITMGLISVNGKTITELGYKVNPGDEVRHENRVLRAEKPVYVLMNKPKGYLTTTMDPQERNTVMHIIGSSVRERIYPVGRLDRNTTGLLLLTNDGELADKLMHPSYKAKKIYKVDLDRPLTKADFQKIQEGVQLEEGRAQVDDVAIVSEDGKTVGVELHIGWNRVVRRIFETLGYEVVKLDRSVYAGLDKKDLPRGHWRFLKKEEIVKLKHFK